MLLLICLLTTPPGYARWRDTRIKSSGKTRCERKRMEGRKRNTDAKFRSLVFHMQFFGLTEMKEDVNRQQVGSGGLKEGIPLPLPISVRGIFFYNSHSYIFHISLSQGGIFQGIHRNDSIVILKSNWISTVSIHS